MSDTFNLAPLAEDQLQKKLYTNLDNEIVHIVRELIRRDIESKSEVLEKRVKEVYDLAKVQGYIAALRKLDSLLSPPSRSGAAPSYEA